MEHAHRSVSYFRAGKFALVVPAEFRDGVEHGEDVLYRRFFQDIIMAGAGHVPAAGFHDIENLAGFYPNGLGGSPDEYVVKVAIVVPDCRRRQRRSRGCGLR